MKKMLAMLTAIALSVAAVSTVEAKITKQPAAKKEATRNMNATTKDMVNPSTPKNEKKEAANALVAMLMENPEEFKLAQLYVQHKQKLNEIAAQREEIAAMNVGWFDFGNVEYKEAKAHLGVLIAKSTEIKKDIAAQERAVGRETSNAIKYAVGGLIVVAGLAAVDYLLGQKVGGFLMTKGGEFVAAVSTRVAPYVESAKKRYKQIAPKMLGGEEAASKTE